VNIYRISAKVKVLVDRESFHGSGRIDIANFDTVQDEGTETTSENVKVKSTKL
jgi:hypothetical protein